MDTPGQGSDFAYAKRQPRARSRSGRKAPPRPASHRPEPGQTGRRLSPITAPEGGARTRFSPITACKTFMSPPILAEARRGCRDGGHSQHGALNGIRVKLPCRLLLSPAQSCWCTYFGSRFGEALSQADRYSPSASRHSRLSGKKGQINCERRAL